MDYLDLKNKIIDRSKKVSLYTLINLYKIDLKDATLLIKKMSEDNDFTTFYSVQCPNCSTVVEDGLFDKQSLQSKKKCFVCKKILTPKDNLFFIIDPKKQSERIEEF